MSLRLHERNVAIAPCTTVCHTHFVTLPRNCLFIHLSSRLPGTIICLPSIYRIRQADFLSDVQMVICSRKLSSGHLFLPSLLCSCQHISRISEAHIPPLFCFQPQRCTDILHKRQQCKGDGHSCFQWDDPTPTPNMPHPPSWDSALVIAFCGQSPGFTFGLVQTRRKIAEKVLCVQ